MLRKMTKPMAFTYNRIIRFQETDAAGVVYFANVLTLCHEAYEASLQAAGIALKPFFSQSAECAVPIVHTAASFYQPMFCGDAIAITLTPQQLSPHSFEIAYQVSPPVSEPSPLNDSNKPKLLAEASTRHICINVRSRRRQPLTSDLMSWLDQFSEPLADLTIDLSTGSLAADD